MVEVHSGDKKKELGKRDKGGKMVTDRPTDDDHGGTKQKLFFAEAGRSLLLFILRRGGAVVAPSRTHPSVSSLHWQKQVIVLCTICRGPDYVNFSSKCRIVW